MRSFHTDHGAIVTYVGRAGFRRAMALGPALEDPQTNGTWIPVLLPDGDITMIAPANVVDVLPDRITDDASPGTGEVIETTRRALSTLMRGLGEPVTANVFQMRCLLDEFLAAIGPIKSTVDVLGRVDPTGALPEAIVSLVNASTRLDKGDVGGCMAAIDAAHAALEGITFERPDSA